MVNGFEDDDDDEEFMNFELAVEAPTRPLEEPLEEILLDHHYAALEDHHRYEEPNYWDCKDWFFY